MKYVPKVVTRTVGRTVLKTKKNSPTILFVAGLTGVVAGAVLACKATLEVDRVLTDHEKGKLDIQRDQTLTAATTDQLLRESRVRLAFDLTKLYAPSVIVGGVGIMCLTKSHTLLKDRNAQLSAAYVALQQFLEKYRGRVRQEVGKDREQDIYYAATPVTLAEDTPDGPKKVFGTKPGMKSPYSAIFDDTNGNWQDADTFNRHFIRLKEAHLTDMLRARGHLFLNEVYDQLDLPRTPTGALCGWTTDMESDSDDFVEIRVYPMQDFHGSLMLDFNVGGLIYENIAGRKTRMKR